MLERSATQSTLTMTDVKQLAPESKVPKIEKKRQTMRCVSRDALVSLKNLIKDLAKIPRKS
jgi:signal transduction histidine kinase